jgi:hypothetical protein
VQDPSRAQLQDEFEDINIKNPLQTTVYVRESH